VIHLPADDTCYAIEVDELRKVYGEVVAVDGISFQVEE